MTGRTIFKAMIVPLGLFGLIGLIGLVSYSADSKAERPKVVDVIPPHDHSPSSATEVSPKPLAASLEAVEPPLVAGQHMVAEPATTQSTVDPKSTISGTITGVGELRRISLLVDGRGHVFTVAPSATITLNGKATPLTDLGAGMTARFRVFDDEPHRVRDIAAFQRIACGVSIGRTPAAYMGIRLDASDVGLGGVQILDVFENSPADLADLYIGDRIVEIDDVRMENSKQILATIHAHGPGDRLRVEVLRDGNATVIPVVLAELRRRVENYEELGCDCPCGDRMRAVSGRLPSGAVGEVDTRFQQELLARNQKLEDMLRQLQVEVRELRATLPRPAVR